MTIHIRSSFLPGGRAPEALTSSTLAPIGGKCQGACRTAIGVPLRKQESKSTSIDTVAVMNNARHARAPDRMWRHGMPRSWRRLLRLVIQEVTLSLLERCHRRVTHVSPNKKNYQREKTSLRSVACAMGRHTLAVVELVVATRGEPKPQLTHPRLSATRQNPHHRERNSSTTPARLAGWRASRSPIQRPCACARVRVPCVSSRCWHSRALAGTLEREVARQRWVPEKEKQMAKGKADGLAIDP